MNTRTTLAAASLALLIGLAGCAGTAAPAPSTSTSAAATDASSVMLDDGWAKAAAAGEMTAIFGVIHNHSDHDITLVSAETPAAGEVQLHETTADATGKMTMSEVDGGFPIPAGGSHTLEPGADHIMLMGLTKPLTAGEETTVTLTFDDGSSTELTVPVKDFTGANEEYTGGDHSSHETPAPTGH